MTTNPQAPFPRKGEIVTHDDAKAFVDYVLSPEGQALVAGAWLMPARSDIPAKRPLLNELKILPTTSDGSSERRPAMAIARSCPPQTFMMRTGFSKGSARICCNQ